jgi:AcrR family transcriptional regulator
LIDAALDLFVEKGFTATRAEEVAAHAGVSKGTLYLYFASKEELLKAVIRERLSAEIEAGAAQFARHTGSTSDLLRQVYTQWWQRVINSPASGVFKLIIAEVRNFPEIAEFYNREVVEPGHALIGRIVQRGIDSGEFAPVDVDVVVQSLVLPMVMLCMHKHSLGACAPQRHDMDPAHFMPAHVDLIVRGLKQSPPEPPPSTTGRRARRSR